MWRIKRAIRQISFIVFLSLMLLILIACWHIPPFIGTAIVIAFDIFVASSWDWL